MQSSDVKQWELYSDQVMEKAEKFTKKHDALSRSNLSQFSLNPSFNMDIEKLGKGSPVFEPSVLDDISITINPTEYSRLIKKSEVSKPITESDFDTLYYMFCETAEAFDSPEQIFDLISGFVQNCNDSIELLKNRPDFNRDISWLETERNTWKLIYTLYRNRLVQNKEESVLNVTDETKIIENLFQTDSFICECQLVIDWLEENASLRVDQSGNLKLSHYMDKTVAWENTLYQLQNESIAYNSTRPLVDALDPDAPLRTKKSIHDLDAEDESRLLDQIFNEIRCGRLQKAVEMCYLCGHAWRAAILQGWMLYNDPNYDPSLSEHVSVIGNPNRDIWKLCAWRLTLSESAPMWKAILGIFCGNLSATLPVCKHWEDLLWIYLKVLVDVRVEQELRAYSTKVYVDLPDEYWSFKFSLEEIFMEIAGNHDTSVRIEASKYERLIQRYIILNQVSELLSVMVEWCLKDDCNYHIVRISAHIVLCLQLVGYEHNLEQANDILRTYVKILMKIGHPRLVAFYTSYLPPKDQILYYSEFLENIQNPDERSQCIEAAEVYHLNIEAITEHLVQNIRERTDENRSTLNIIPETTEEDLKKISSLDWIVYYPHQRGEAIWQTNALIRYFLISKKLHAARLAFNKIPEDSIIIVSELYRANEVSLKDNSALVPSKFTSAIKEYLCYKSYLDAEEGFSDWFYTFHKDKPIEPTKPSNSAQFTEKVAYEHHLANFNAKLERWKTATNYQTKMVQSYLYNVLLFPDDGWLVDENYTIDESRIKELHALRKLCIPKIALLLHSVLHSTENYSECIKLADIIVSEVHRIYEVYSKQDISELLKKICESSISLLDHNKDPWGHPVSS